MSGTLATGHDDRSETEQVIFAPYRVRTGSSEGAYMKTGVFSVNRTPVFKLVSNILCIQACAILYNATTQNNYFVKGSHKYDVYLVEENKAYLNWPNKDRMASLVLTQRDVAR